MSILAIDLGQSKSVFVFGGEQREERFGSFNTTSDAVRKILIKHKPTLVVVEICPLAAMVHDIAAELGIRALVADTTQDAWAWRNVKRKTDRDDALKLLRLAMVNQINPVYIPPPEMRQWRGLLKAREAAVVAQTRCKVRIRALLVTADRKLTRGKGGWTQAALDELRQWSRPLAECSPRELWRGALAIELERLELLDKHGPPPAVGLDHPGCRHGDRGHDRGGARRSAPLPLAPPGGLVRRPDAAALSVGSDGPPGPHQQAWQRDVAADPEPGGLGVGAL